MRAMVARLVTASTTEGSTRCPTASREAVPVAGQQRIHRQQPGHRRDHVLEHHVLPARDPAPSRAWRRTPASASSASTNTGTDQPHSVPDPDRLVRPAAPPHRRQHAERDAQRPSPAGWPPSPAPSWPGRTSRCPPSPGATSSPSGRGRRAAGCRRSARTAPASGWSSPIACRVASTTDCGARSPTTASTGSIGTTRPIRKVISTSPNSVTGTLPSVAGEDAEAPQALARRGVARAVRQRAQVRTR